MIDTDYSRRPKQFKHTTQSIITKTVHITPPH